MSPEVTVAVPPFHTTDPPLIFMELTPATRGHLTPRDSPIVLMRIKLKYKKIKTCFRRLWAGTLSSTRLRKVAHTNSVLLSLFAGDSQSGAGSLRLMGFYACLPPTIPPSCLRTVWLRERDCPQTAQHAARAETDGCDAHARVDEQPPENVTSRQCMISAVTLRGRPKKNVKGKKTKNKTKLLIMTWFDPTDTWSKFLSNVLQYV